MGYTILIAEDDADIVELLILYLENEGYRILRAGDGSTAYQILEKEKPDLAIIDIMMPHMNGYDLTRKIRENYNIPILILSAKNQDSDKILGLELGADDYMTKPFNPLEIVARVRAALRRFYFLNENTAEDENGILRVGDLELDTGKIRFTKGGKEIPLTPTEYKIIAFLMKNPGRVYTKVQIYEHVNGAYFESDDNTMMVHISKLREKLEDDSKNPTYLKTVRGLGYKIENLDKNT